MAVLNPLGLIFSLRNLLWIIVSSIESSHKIYKNCITWFYCSQTFIKKELNKGWNFAYKTQHTYWIIVNILILTIFMFFLFTTFCSCVKFHLYQYYTIQIKYYTVQLPFSLILLSDHWWFFVFGMENSTWRCIFFFLIINYAKQNVKPKAYNIYSKN